MRYFHGTHAVLVPGDVLLPGDEIDVTVHSTSAHVYLAVADESPEGLWAAIDLAYEFGCYAADVYCRCPETSDDGFGHFEAYPQASFQIECVRIYEVAPHTESLEVDPSDDFEPGASMRTARATVLAQVDFTGQAMA